MSGISAPSGVLITIKMTRWSGVWGTGICGLALLAGCLGGDDDPGMVYPSAEPRQNVMVVDRGFDLSVPDLRGRVAGAFTRTCQAPTDDSSMSMGAGTPMTFEEVKRAYIADLMQPDTSCHLVPGIDAKPDPLAAVARYRQRWNNMIRGQRYGSTAFTRPEWDELTSALD